MIPKKPASDEFRGGWRFSDEIRRQPKPGSGAMLAAALPAQCLVGLAIVLALVILITNRMR
jgi:hypothetical protein